MDPARLRCEYLYYIMSLNYYYSVEKKILVFAYTQVYNMIKYDECHSLSLSYLAWKIAYPRDKAFRIPLQTDNIYSGVYRMKKKTTAIFAIRVFIP